MGVRIRQEILLAAARLFHRHGHERTSVRQIGEVLSMTSGLLFHGFSAKEETLVAVMKKEFATCSHACAVGSKPRRGCPRNCL